MPSDINDIDETFRQAVACHSAGKLRQAEAHYRQILQQNPRHGPALHLLGVIAYQANRPDASEGLIRRAITCGARSAEALSNLGNALKAQGRAQEAVDSYRQALALNPKHVNALNNLGAALQESGDVEGAIAAYRQALTLAPDSPGPLNNLGVALQTKEQHEAAVEAFQKVLNLLPEHGEARSNLGISLEQLGREQEARAAYELVVKQHPDFAQGHNNLGALLLKQRRHDEAIAAFKEAVALDRFQVDYHRNLASGMSAVGRYEEAVESLRQAARLAPGDARIPVRLGEALWAMGMGEDAEAHFESALKIEYDNADALVGLAAVRYQETAPDTAGSLLKKAAAADPGHRRARFYLGMIKDQQGEADEAEQIFAGLLAEGRGFLVDSWHYAKGQSQASTRLFSSSFETLRHGLSLAPKEGLVLEFGVLFGRSLNFIAGHRDGPVHGFDSFQGLPEDWGEIRAGAYTTGGRLPEVADNVRLHAGWFEDSLPRFLAEHPGPVAFMNVDCDLYSSTKTIFDHLAPRIVPGSVIVFDEYLCTGQWREDEYRAFQEAVAAHGWRYEYGAFNLFAKQATVVMR